jgi:hypothetical protein
MRYMQRLQAEKLSKNELTNVVSLDRNKQHLSGGDARY